MFKITDLIDLQTLSESVELEFKQAQGQDGQGKLPQDFWPTYCAMANTRGGYVVLGVKEKQGQFIPVGINNPEKIKNELFNNLNNQNLVNVNLLTDEDVQTTYLNEKLILVIHVPTAARHQKLVYLKNNPLENTYIRLHEGDRHCSHEQVKRMLAEQVEDSRDDKIFIGFDLNDIEQESLNAYKQLLAIAKPQHPWLELNNIDLMAKIGGWRKDRQTGVEGMTLAGILMFGTWQAIQDAVPNYFVDYQERPEAKTELRWIDRLCPDGTWSGNIFDFYRRTYRKLTNDLKIPFKLKDGVRQDDTLIHVALREALVNTLVHADFTGRASILIVKRPDMFGFRNPGLMRIPPEIAIKGGETDCRNRRMHQMFLNIGAGERAGSGIPKIYSGWESANWRAPKLYEKTDHTEQTLLELSTASLIPESVSEQLRILFGASFNTLDDFERMIVTTAAIEGWINHQRACQLTTKHSRDVTLALPRLESRGFLVSSGERKDKSYSLPGMEQPPSPEDVFSNALSPAAGLTHNEGSLTHSMGGLTHNEEKFVYKAEKHRDPEGRYISALLDRPFIDQLETLTPSFKEQLSTFAKLANEKKRLTNDEMRDVIIKLCNDHFIAISVLSELTHRTSQNIRQSHLKPMVEKGELQLAFPNKPNSPKQGYTVK
ncbi:RNA-binding domain-containing protein [Rahnella laticis]|uniref:RNA-binding domain-containing protein n=1 Tax=Rahnella laticis TaxID=2787622 RepID=UPI0018A302C1|nr:RNA-binding domain-containing protein [Rahnella laticis]MBF7997066.1 putative DNA binding domain-containing protein [Rahnella laticis]